LACFVEIFERYVYQQTNCGKLSVSPGILSLPSIDTINKVGRGVFAGCYWFSSRLPSKLLPLPPPSSMERNAIFSRIIHRHSATSSSRSTYYTTLLPKNVFAWLPSAQWNKINNRIEKTKNKYWPTTDTSCLTDFRHPPEFNHAGVIDGGSRKSRRNSGLVLLFSESWNFRIKKGEIISKIMRIISSSESSAFHFWNVGNIIRAKLCALQN
jgi:hypothetical protein